MSPDRDPCSGCNKLMSRPPLAPYCEVGAHYGQIGCRRAPPRGIGRSVAAAGGHDGGLPPETARRQAQRTRGGRRG